MPSVADLREDLVRFLLGRDRRDVNPVADPDVAFGDALHRLIARACAASRPPPRPATARETGRRSCSAPQRLRRMRRARRRAARVDGGPGWAPARGVGERVRSSQRARRVAGRWLGRGRSTTTPLLRRSAGTSLTSVSAGSPSSARPARALRRREPRAPRGEREIREHEREKEIAHQRPASASRPRTTRGPSSTKSARSSTRVSSQPRSASASPPVKYTTGVVPSARATVADGAIERRGEREPRAVADGGVRAAAEQVEPARDGRRRRRAADVARVAVERGREQAALRA